MAHLRPSERSYTSGERRILFVWLVAAVVFAVLVQSALFLRSDWMLGDLAYHRGVAYSMLGGDFQGSGPFAGLLSYFGGLYPILAALVIDSLGWSFEETISVASWIAPILLVGAFALLAISLWRTDGFRAGVAVVLGCGAGALSTDLSDIWVNSLMIGGHNYWPVYPRDVALALLVAASAFALTRNRLARIGGTGVSIGLAVLFHAQIGVVGAAVVVAIWVTQLIRGSRSARDLWNDVGFTIPIVVSLSTWWALPRVWATLGGSLELASFPRAGRFDVPSPVDYLTLFGVVGVLGIASLLRWIFVARDLPERLKVWMIGWLVVVLPLIAIGSIDADLGVITSRRSWMLLSPALIILSADFLGWIRDRAPSVVSIVAWMAVLGLALIPTALGMLRHLPDRWPTGTYQGRVLDLEAWSPVWEYLRADIASGTKPEVVASDAFAGSVWSWTGAHVISMVLPGYMKLGFDVEGETGWSYPDRVAAIDAAFGQGIPGICRLANNRHSDYVLLEKWGDRYAVRDVNPAASYRVDPEHRTLESVRLEVKGGIHYVDRNAYDALLIESGVSYELPAWTADVDRLVVELRSSAAVGDPAIRFNGESGSVLAEFDSEGGFQRVEVLRPGNEPGPVAMKALRSLALLRVVGFDSVPVDEALALVDGRLALFRRDHLCSGL